ncbi:hypothetical protein PFISCL1PPCAC_14502, partial [Pristionchus fissidentatus]
EWFSLTLSPSTMAEEFGKELDKLDDESSRTSKRIARAPPSPDDIVEEQLKEGDFLITMQSTFLLHVEYRREVASSMFDVMRRSDGWVMRIEFEKDDDENRGPKRIDLEGAVQRILYQQRDPSLVNHLHLCVDMGSHAPWNYAMFPQYLLTIPEFLQEADQIDKDRGTFLKVAIHSFIGLRHLHSTEIVHGAIRPENILIGMERSCRKILIGNFSSASSNQRELPKPNDVKDSIYSSRARQRNFEPTKKDDLESWTYCVAEMFNKKLLPWHPDQKFIGATAHKESLALKRAFCHGKMWTAQREMIFEEFKVILQLLSKIRATGELPYELIFSLLSTAAKHTELSVFAASPWSKSNRGALVTPSKFETAPEPVEYEDFVSNLP